MACFAALALALGVDEGRSHGVLDHGVVGEEAQPSLSVLGLRHLHRLLRHLECCAHGVASPVRAQRAWVRGFVLRWPVLSADGLGLDLGDHGVGEPPKVIDLVLEGLDVGSHDIGPAEADDHVGDTLFLEASDPVDARRRPSR